MLPWSHYFSYSPLLKFRYPCRVEKGTTLPIVVNKGDHWATFNSSGVVNCGIGDKSSQRLMVVDHENTVTAMAFSPDGAFLVVGCASGIIRWYRTKTGKLIKQKKILFQSITTIVFSRKYLYICDALGFIYYFDESDQLIRVYTNVTEPAFTVGAFGSNVIYVTKYWVYFTRDDEKSKFWLPTVHNGENLPCILSADWKDDYIMLSVALGKHVTVYQVSTIDDLMVSSFQKTCRFENRIVSLCSPDNDFTLACDDADIVYVLSGGSIIWTQNFVETKLSKDTTFSKNERSLLCFPPKDDTIFAFKINFSFFLEHLKNGECTLNALKYANFLCNKFDVSVTFLNKILHNSLFLCEQQESSEELKLELFENLLQWVCPEGKFAFVHDNILKNLISHIYDIFGETDAFKQAVFNKRQLLIHTLLPVPMISKIIDMLLAKEWYEEVADFLLNCKVNCLDIDYVIRICIQNNIWNAFIHVAMKCNDFLLIFEQFHLVLMKPELDVLEFEFLDFLTNAFTMQEDDLIMFIFNWLIDDTYKNFFLLLNKHMDRFVVILEIVLPNMSVPFYFENYVKAMLLASAKLKYPVDFRVKMFEAISVSIKENEYNFSPFMEQTCKLLNRLIAKDEYLTPETATLKGIIAVNFIAEKMSPQLRDDFIICSFERGRLYPAVIFAIANGRYDYALELTLSEQFVINECITAVLNHLLEQFTEKDAERVSGLTKKLLQRMIISVPSQTTAIIMDLPVILENANFSYNVFVPLISIICADSNFMRFVTEKFMLNLICATIEYFSNDLRAADIAMSQILLNDEKNHCFLEIAFKDDKLLNIAMCNKLEKTAIIIALLREIPELAITKVIEYVENADNFCALECDLNIFYSLMTCISSQLISNSFFPKLFDALLNHTDVSNKYLQSACKNAYITAMLSDLPEDQINHLNNICAVKLGLFFEQILRRALHFNAITFTQWQALQMILFEENCFGFDSISIFDVQVDVCAVCCNDINNDGYIHNGQIVHSCCL